MSGNKIDIDINYDNLSILEMSNIDDIKHPVIISCPHSGITMPEEFIKNSKLSQQELRKSEDSYVDELLNPLADEGFAIIKLNISRSFIDVNRDKAEIDDTMYHNYPANLDATGSRKCRVGLGVIPRIVSVGYDIYDGKLCYNQSMQRISEIYDVYHHQLSEMISKVKEKYGFCLVIDCHSMPSKICEVISDNVDISLGTLFGKSCPVEIAENFANSLNEDGYAIEVNRPYSGGFITYEYCLPREKQYTFQIEINRDLYMDEESFTKKPNFDKLSDDLTKAILNTSKKLQNI